MDNGEWIMALQLAAPLIIFNEFSLYLSLSIFHYPLKN
jgi:hypothetical protein